MSIEKPANERLNLYNRFKESLRSGDESTFYDADDLLIIIDQAVDLQDEYTEIEAIMRGFRFFPDNEELAARRAFLYYDLSLDEGVDNTRRQLTPDSTMSKILRIRRLGDDIAHRDEVVALLNDIVNTPGLLTDEEIIQLVDCAAASNNVRWLQLNEKKLRKKTDYLPTLLYEIFIVSDLMIDREYSLRLLEELTELQPFNIDFWNALAQVQVRSLPGEEPGEDAALNSLDFALAIDSMNPEALTLKASILLSRNEPEAAEQTLRPISDPPASQIAAETYICALVALERFDEATARLSSYLKIYPNDIDLLNLALKIEHPLINEFLNASYDISEDYEKGLREWIGWAEQFYRRGDLTQAITILEYLHGTGALVMNTYGYRLLFSALYATGKYDRCIDLYNELERSNPDMLLTEMILANLMSYVRKGNRTDAKKAFKAVNDRLPMNLTESWTMSTSIESIGMSNFMTAYKSMVNSRGAMNADLLDIFGFPYNPTEQEE